MRSARLFLLISIISNLNVYSQKTIGEYKVSVDSFMSAQLDTAILNGMICSSYMATLENKSTVVYAGSYSDDKDTILKDVGTIGFFYDYYCEQLNYTFHWYLNHVEDGKVLPAFMIAKTFPVCIQKGEFCHLITKDSAVKIAQADSIKYPDNYYVEFLRPAQSNEFFWIISGMDKNIYDYSMPPKDNLAPPIPNWKRVSTRIIEASTGKIISLQEYYRLDKDK